jgi:hypothetical protein
MGKCPRRQRFELGVGCVSVEPSSEVVIPVAIGSTAIGLALIGCAFLMISWAMSRRRKPARRRGTYHMLVTTETLTVSTHRVIGKENV